jgi:glycosyltransferase involved in cell wall biosynthesis
METQKQKVICIHLLNDFSGSPLVFSQAIDSLSQKGTNLVLFTNSHKGFLSDIEVGNRCVIPYQWSSNKIITLLSYLYSQIWLFLTVLLKYRNEKVIIYINTVLPFGAALAGFCSGKRVVYHLHETSVKPKILKSFLFWIANNTASDAIYVSEFLKKTEVLNNVICHHVHNALPKKFVEQANRYDRMPNQDEFNILMLCSLKVYKGVNEYVSLAKLMPQYNFTLVLNSDWDSIMSFFSEVVLPSNLKLYPCQKDVHDFYRQANLLLNLSDPEQWVETFGMTILEGMVYGLPAIVPPVGGVIELIENGVNGYRIHPKNLDELQSVIQQLASKSELYATLQLNAKRKAMTFNAERFCERINQVL